jgi:predicted AAA+ superfamily ATPase
MTGIKRNLYARANDLLGKFPVIGIIGSRQSGKTTLSKQLRPNWKYLDLENPRDYDYVTADPLMFFEQNPHSIIIDEAQLDTNLFKVLRGVIDQNRTQKNRFILTGSSSPELQEKIAETLAGRIAYIELSPFKTNEKLQAPLSKLYDFFLDPRQAFDFKALATDLTLQNFREQWLYGGYPEPTLELQNWNDWMQQYRDSYINRDIARLFPSLNKINYRRFLNTLSKLSGTIINKSDLARSLEVSQPTVTQYINIAHGTFLWRNMESFTNGHLKSLIKMPKGMLRDSGLLHFLLKIHDLESLYSDPIVGLSFEGFVIEELIRGIDASGATNMDYSFYRTKNGAEIDLIVSGPYGLIPIEIKYGSFTPLNKLHKLREFVESNNLPRGIVINNSNSIEYLAPNIIQIPVNYL